MRSHGTGVVGSPPELRSQSEPNSPRNLVQPGSLSASVSTSSLRSRQRNELLRRLRRGRGSTGSASSPTPALVLSPIVKRLHGKSGRKLIWGEKMQAVEEVGEYLESAAGAAVYDKLADQLRARDALIALWAFMLEHSRFAFSPHRAVYFHVWWLIVQRDEVNVRRLVTVRGKRSKTILVQARRLRRVIIDTLRYVLQQLEDPSTRFSDSPLVVFCSRYLAYAFVRIPGCGRVIASAIWEATSCGDEEGAASELDTRAHDLPPCLIPSCHRHAAPLRVPSIKDMVAEVLAEAPVEPDTPALQSDLFSDRDGALPPPADANGDAIAANPGADTGLDDDDEDTELNFDDVDDDDIDDDVDDDGDDGDDTEHQQSRNVAASTGEGEATADARCAGSHQPQSSHQRGGSSSTVAAVANAASRMYLSAEHERREFDYTSDGEDCRAEGVLAASRRHSAAAATENATAATTAQATPVRTPTSTAPVSTVAKAEIVRRRSRSVGSLASDGVRADSPAATNGTSTTSSPAQAAVALNVLALPTWSEMSESPGLGGGRAPCPPQYVLFSSAVPPSVAGELERLFIEPFMAISTAAPSPTASPPTSWLLRFREDDPFLWKFLTHLPRQCAQVHSVDLVEYRRIPGYHRVVGAVLSVVGRHRVQTLPKQVIAAVDAFVIQPELLGRLVRVTLARTDANNPAAVDTWCTLLETWFAHHRPSISTVAYHSRTFSFHLLQSAILTCLDTDHYYIVLRILALMYSILDVWRGVVRVHWLADILLDTVFFDRFFLHWHPDVRHFWHMLTCFRFVRTAVPSIAPVSTLELNTDARMQYRLDAHVARLRRGQSDGAVVYLAPSLKQWDSVVQQHSEWRHSASSLPAEQVKLPEVNLRVWAFDEND